MRSILSAKFALLLLALSLAFVTPAHAEFIEDDEPVDRTAYAESIFKSLESILPVLIDSAQKALKASLPKESPTDPDPRYVSRRAGDISIEAGTLAYLKHCARILGEDRPRLYFVDEPEKFVMQPGSAPVLMRSPAEAHAPIFVNRTALNSPNFQLSLVQLMKLMLHELGHKTGKHAIAVRDEWAQNVENTLELFYHQSGSRRHDVGDPTDVFVEVFSLPAPVIEHALIDEATAVQPTQWIYVQSEGRILELTKTLRKFAQENSTLTRTIGTEVIGIIMEVSAAFTEAATRFLGPLTDKMQRMFQKPGEKMEGGLFDKLPKDMIGMTIIDIQQISQSPHEIIFEATQSYVRSHAREMRVEITGFPWPVDGEYYALHFKIDKRSLTQKQPTVSMQYSPDPDYNHIAKVGRRDRKGTQLQRIEVSFEAEQMPMFLDLGIHFKGGVYRLPAAHRFALGGGRFAASFEFETPESQLGTYADRIFIDNEQMIFLDHQVEIREETYTPRPFAPDDILPESFGLWGVRQDVFELGKKFSHLQPLFQTFIAFDAPHFLVNPMNIWIEFEVRDDIQISQAELMWSVEHVTVDISEKPNEFIPFTERVDGVDRVHKYTEGGTMVTRINRREMVLFTADGMDVQPGTVAGYKRIMMKAITPFRRAKDTTALHEAHLFPRAMPLGIRIVDSELRTYSHNFPTDPSITAQRQKITCESLLALMRKPE